MGDAGPPSPPPGFTDGATGFGTVGAQDAPPLREVKVLVTGFGPFKSFLINPSWLIASTLPDELYPASSSSSRPAYKIALIVHQSPVRVSYSTVSEVVPALISKHDPDYILHIGVAGGRDCYSLETRAHRDGYRIKDVDDSDGFSRGESHWKKEGVPDVLYVGWDEADVLRRWEEGVKAGLKERGFLDPGSQSGGLATQGAGASVDNTSIWGPGTTAANVAAAVATARAEENRRRSIVKLSRDAGRFLCEYELFESLSVRWIEAHRYKHPHVRPESGHQPHSHDQARTDTESTSQQHILSEQQDQRSHPSQTEQTSTPPSSDTDTDPEAEERRKSLAHERLGKVAFLHVPGWTGVEDVKRGVLIAEEAIRALVGSWEDGFRRPVGSGFGMPGTAVGVPLDGGAFTSQHSESHGQGQGQGQSQGQAQGTVLAAGGSAGISWRA